MQVCAVLITTSMEGKSDRFRLFIGNCVMYIMFLPYEFVFWILGEFSEPQTEKLNADYICLYPCIYICRMFI